MSLLEKFLPGCHFRERHQILVDVTPAEALDVAETMDMADGDRVVAALMFLRTLPGRVLDRMGMKDALPPRSSGLPAFVRLERDGDREVALGLIGRFWRPDGGLVRIAGADQFLAFDRPGTPKLVLSFAAEPAGDRTRLVTETRIWCPDEASRRRLLPYWLVIRLPSGLIRRRMLGALKRRLEGPVTSYRSI